MDLLNQSTVFLLISIRCMGMELDIKMVLPFQEGVREYVYYTEKITWNEAAMFCENNGGSLAKIDPYDFQYFLINAFETTYGINPFPDDYWTGLFQPSQGDFRWASDCSEVYYTAHLEKSWDSGKMCFKFDKDFHDGSREPCSSNRAFICEFPLPTAYSCTLKEIFTANKLGTEVVDLADCEALCDADIDCWMVLFTPPSGCVKLAYNTPIPAAGVQGVRIRGKFCTEVSMNSTVITPSPPDSSNTPIVNCSAQPSIPISTTTIIAPSFLPTPTMICATQTITSISISSCSPHTLTENIYHTLDCATETLTILPTPSCPAEISTVRNSASCIASPCVCSPTVSTVIIPPSVCSDISPTLPSPSSSVNAEQMAKDISQNLTIDEKTTSAYKRKLISVPDDRPVSKTMGYVGLCFVTVPFVCIFIMDIRKMILDGMRRQMYRQERRYPPINRFAQIWKH